MLFRSLTQGAKVVSYVFREKRGAAGASQSADEVAVDVRAEHPCASLISVSNSLYIGAVLLWDTYIHGLQDRLHERRRTGRAQCPLITRALCGAAAKVRGGSTQLGGAQRWTGRERRALGGVYLCAEAGQVRRSERGRDLREGVRCNLGQLSRRP